MIVHFAELGHGDEIQRRVSYSIDLFFCVTIGKIVEEFHAAAHAIYPVTQIPVVRNLSSTQAEKDLI